METKTITFKKVNDKLEPHLAIMPDCNGGCDNPGSNSCLCQAAINNATPFKDNFKEKAYNEAKMDWDLHYTFGGMKQGFLRMDTPPAFEPKENVVYRTAAEFEIENGLAIIL